MTHKEVYNMFARLFPLYSEGALTWFPNGRNSIRIRIDKNMEFIFTFHNNRTWSFETLDSWMKYNKVARKKD